MTVRDIIDRVYGRIDDYNKAYWNQQRMLALINQKMDALAVEFSVNHQEQYTEFDSVQGQELYEVPRTYVANEMLYVNSTWNREIKFISSISQLQSIASDWDEESDVPLYALIWGSSGRRQLRVYPTFSTDGTTIKWWYYGWPPEVEEDNDEPNVPLEWHATLAEAVINQIKTDDREITVADNLLLWERGIRKLKLMDVTREIMEKGGKYGSVESSYPEIKGSRDLGLEIAPTGWNTVV